MTVPGAGTWLITGGCGFIGKSLVKQLLASGVANIRVVDNFSGGDESDFTRWVATEVTLVRASDQKAQPPRGLELWVADLINPSVCLRAMAGIDYVVHLAAMPSVPVSMEDPYYDFQNNVLPTINVLEAVRAQNTPPRTVIASSCAAVGETAVPIHEGSVANPVSPYGAGKLACEGYGLAYARSFQLDIASLRFSNVYGPGSSRKESLVAKLLRDLENGRGIQVHGDGLQTRDFIYVDDLVAAVVAVACKSQGAQIYQVATGMETAVRAVAASISTTWAEMTGNHPDLTHTPERMGDVRRNYACIDKITQLIGWKASMPVGEGLRKTVAWWLEEYGSGL